MDHGIRPLADAMAVMGPAFTVSSPPGQNLAIHRAIAEARPGDVLVVAMSGDCRFGPFGEILALACQRRGIAGLVLDATVRDGRDIEALGFAVFCRGLAPAGTRKEAPGELGGSIRCGGVNVDPGDIVVADRDGVVVIPAAAMADVDIGLQRIVEKEARIKEGIAAGRTTLDLMNLT
jgi:4-hydroxy-4-methyl-2-oxoglutarate aldolase